jgi:hypothetical protein
MKANRHRRINRKLLCSNSNPKYGGNGKSKAFRFFILDLRRKPMNKYSSLLLLLLLFISSCSKEIYNQYRSLSGYANSFGKFSPGSYWVYQKDTTSITDSIFATQLLQDNKYNTHDDVTELCEGWLVRSRSTYDSTVTLKVLIGSFDSTVTYSYFNWQIKCRYSSNSLTQLIDPVTYHSSLSVNGTNYGDVYEVSHKGTPQDSFLKVNGFLESEIGLIRWDVYNSDSTVTSWTLLRKNVTIE